MPSIVSEKRLDEHLRFLTEKIGVRLAGPGAEQQAADYAAQQLEAAGAEVRQEQFQVNSRAVESERLEVFVDGAWREFRCSLFSNTPGTQGEPVEAPLVFFEAPSATLRADYTEFRGKAVVHLGCHIESREAYRRLVDAGPAFLLFVDVRYPANEPRADGMFPSYTNDLGAVPVANVAYMDAWSWCEKGAEKARLTVSGGMRPGISQNVIAELPGEDGESGLLFVGAHHDTQADSVGADDNASGVAGLLEVARVLAPLPRRWTIRLISFGAEEQLSVGSAAYVRSHREELKRRGGLMFNLDSYGSWMGWCTLVCNGPPELNEFLRSRFEAEGAYARCLPDIMPYADHFPFVAAGVPGVTLLRENCGGGRVFQHQPHDDLSRVSTGIMARQLRAVAGLLAELAICDELPFETRIPDDQSVAVEQFWEDLFGGW